jgi:hypothetical protein
MSSVYIDIPLILANECLKVMKLLTATLYTHYTTAVVDDSGMAQKDRLLAGPEGERLVLAFRRVG